jgi:hypothetical protein
MQRYIKYSLLLTAGFAMAVPSQGNAETWISKKWHMILNKQTPQLAPAPASTANAVCVASLSLSSNSVRYGGSVTLTVHLTGPAPAGGFTVGINRNSNGAMDTLVVNPTAITVPAGSTEGSFGLRTQHVPGTATRIIFSAAGSRQAVELNLTN